MNDNNLGKRFSYGGEAELEEVIDTYGEKLLRYATAIICNYQDAENVMQDVFLSAYQNRHSFDGKNLSAWLYKITYHRSINHLRKSKLLSFVELTNDFIASDNSDSLSEETLTALKKIKPKERAILYARIIERQSYEELSAYTGSSTSTLRKQYERAKNKLAKQLTEEYKRKGIHHEFIG